MDGVVREIQRVIKATKGNRLMAAKTKKLRKLLKSAKSVCDGFYIAN
jgi:hypothetical protein